MEDGETPMIQNLYTACLLVSTRANTNIQNLSYTFLERFISYLQKEWTELELLPSFLQFKPKSTLSSLQSRSSKSKTDHSKKFHLLPPLPPLSGAGFRGGGFPLASPQFWSLHSLPTIHLLTPQAKHTRVHTHTPLLSWKGCVISAFGAKMLKEL